MLSYFRVDRRKRYEYATCGRVCCRKRKTVLRFQKFPPDTSTQGLKFDLPPSVLVTNLPLGFL